MNKRYRNFQRIPFALLAMGLGALGATLTSCGPRNYPLRTCVVCDHSLGERGGPVAFVYENQKVEVCGEEHRARFFQEAPQYLAKIKEVKVL